MSIAKWEDVAGLNAGPDPSALSSRNKMRSIIAWLQTTIRARELEGNKLEGERHAEEERLEAEKMAEEDTVIAEMLVEESSLTLSNPIYTMSLRIIWLPATKPPSRQNK